MKLSDFLAWLVPKPAPEIKRGAKSKAVADLQVLLNKRTGAGLRIDRIFGPETEKAVKMIQRKHGIDVDGIVGPDTRRALRRW